jgi:glutamate synthase (NADPH/NADH) large chain
MIENYNMAMIDLDEMEEEDIRLIKGLITKHLRFTGSNVAEELLTDWSKHAAGFTKVMPKEYKAVLQNKSKRKYKLIA